jgi:acetyltransferase-like isoleucine patch superfamily enzyme
LGVTVEDNVFLGPNCVLTNDPNPRAYIKKTGAALQNTLIRSHATVGANATILCGVTIGQHAFIGAGAVVLKPVLDFALMVGNPARHAGWMCSCATRLPIPASAGLNTVTACPHCGACFRVLDAGLIQESSS